MKLNKFTQSLITVFCCVCVSFAALAQRTITGKVTDNKGEELFGVTVVEKGSNPLNGVVTDFDGTYSIKLQKSEGAVLIFTMTGMATQEKKVGASDKINIQLKEDAIMMEQEVVVTGVRPSDRLDVVGNKGTVNAEVLERAPTSDAITRMQGQVSGLEIKQSGGLAGSASTIRVRGTGSISAGSDPLIVVDGIPITTGANGDGGGAVGQGNLGFQTSPVSTINPSDIETMEVLKDAAATALYGARGSNGVILITTKRGKPGKTRFNASYYTGVQETTNRIDLMNGPQYLQILDAAYENSFLRVPYNRSSYPTEEAIRNAINSRKDNYLTNPGVPVLKRYQAEKINTDWMDMLLRRGIIHEASLSGSGGKDNITFYAGGSFRSETGPMIGNSFERFGGRFNLDNKVNSILKVGVLTGITYTINNFVPAGSGSDGQGGFGVAQTRSLPIFPVYWSEIGKEGHPSQNLSFNPFYNAYGNFGGTNIALTQNERYSFFKQKEFRNISTFYGDVKILQREYAKINDSTGVATPIKHELGFRSDVSIDYYNQLRNQYLSRYVRFGTSPEFQGTNTPVAFAQDARVFFTNVNANNLFKYYTELGPKHKIDALAGMSYQQSVSINNAVGSEGFANDYTQLVSSGKIQIARSGNESEFRFLSFFVNANYKFNNKYILKGTVRTDGSSRFGADRRYGTFPSAGFVWIISEEGFMKSAEFRGRPLKYTVPLLRFSASYGRSGNAQVGNFQSLGLWANNATYQLQPGTAPRQLANRSVTWEKSDQFDLTANIGLFEHESGVNKVELTTTYYHRTSKDMLLALPLPLSTGIENRTFVQNIGRLRNSGWEFTVKTNNIIPDVNANPDGLQWITDFNISFNRNKVLDLGGLQPSEVSGQGDVRTYVGQPLGTLFLANWAGVDPETGEELIYGPYRNVSRSGENRYLSDSVIYLGDGVANDPAKWEAFRPYRISQIDSSRVPQFTRQTIPKFFGGITNTVRWKGFELAVMFTFTYGNWILDEGERRQSYVTGATNLRASVLDYWTPNNRNTNIPKPYYSAAPSVIEPPATDKNFDDPYRNRNTTRFLHDASYLRLRNVMLAYNIPVNKLKQKYPKMFLTNARVYVTAQNLYVWTKFPGWDPEVVTNLQDAQSRNLSQGITNLDFPQVRILTAGINIGF